MNKAKKENGKEEALGKLLTKSMGILEGEPLDEIVYESLVDLLVKGIIEYSPKEDTFVLMEDEDKSEDKTSNKE